MNKLNLKELYRRDAALMDHKSLKKLWTMACTFLRLKLAGYVDLDELDVEHKVKVIKMF